MDLSHTPTFTSSNKTWTFRSKSKKFLFRDDLAGAGTDNICALGFTEGAKASIDVFGSNSKIVSGARLELGQRTGHGERKGVDLPDLLPVLLRRAAVRVVLMEGVQVIAVHSRAAPVRLCNAPGQHDAGLTRHQLQLELLRRWRLLGLRGQTRRHGCRRQRGETCAGAPRGRWSGYRTGFLRRVLHKHTHKGLIWWNIFKIKLLKWVQV